jgi:translation elongation factor EF-Tu-like GTPase
MFSTRFSRPVIVTRHAQQRMQERDIPAELLLHVIDTGHIRYSDEARLWAWLEVPGRHDNLLCAALVLEQAVVVKTVMHHWEITP